MRPLPRPLARWADELAVLSREAAQLIGPWFPILERLRGAVSLPNAQAEGEPDGFSGLSRRGPYARLIATEWALLDHAPDEFVRRAGAGEHLFNELARAEKSGAGRVVVLFDAGPWQLGAPRLAHLAWLLVLARHARSRSCHFSWGVLQSPERELRESSDAADIRWLMAARRSETVDAAMINEWASRLGPAGKHEERWLVAHARDEPTAARLEASTLAIVEEDDPAASVLVVEATARSSVKQRAMLSLPLRRACGRLLRDPFRDEPPPGAVPAPLAPGAQIVFSPTSPHVLARLASGEIVALGIPNAPGRLQRLATFKPPPRMSVVAAGWRKGRMYVLTSEDPALWLHVGRRNRWPLPQRLVRRFELPEAAADTLNGLFVDRLGRRLWFRDQRSGLNTVDLDRMMIVTADAKVIAWGSLPARGEVAFVQGEARGLLELRTSAARRPLEHADVRVNRGFVVAATSGEEPSFVALGADDGEWLLYSRPWMAPKGVLLSTSTLVYGAALVEGRCCLLVQSLVPERLDFVDNKGVVASVVFPGEVEHACLHPNGHWIAAQVAGGLSVVDRRPGSRLRWSGP